MSESLYILCDEIRMGKTTAINDSLSALRPHLGFICPDINGSRVLVNLENMSMHEFQIKKPVFSGDVKVGKFAFLGSTFKLAHQILMDIPDNFDGFVIIDEIGKLELKNKGLEPALSQYLERQKEFDIKTIVVVRDYLLDEVIRRYDLRESRVLNPQAFKNHFTRPPAHVG